MKLVAILLLMTGCGREEVFADWSKKIQQEPESIKQQEPVSSLKTLLDSFLSDCHNKYGADTSDVDKLESIHYGNPSTKEKPGTIGVCNTWHYDNGDLAKSTIVVKEMQEPIMAKALLYHELGHCVLGLEHTSQESKTIMSPSMHSDAYYEYNWDELVEDMCKKYSK